MAEAGRYGSVNVPSVPTDEPVAILRGSNISTPRVLEMAVTLAEAAGEPEDHVAELRSRAKAIRAWQSEDPERTTATEPRQEPEAE